MESSESPTTATHRYKALPLNQDFYRSPGIRPTSRLPHHLPYPANADRHQEPSLQRLRLQTRHHARCVPGAPRCSVQWSSRVPLHGQDREEGGADLRDEDLRNLHQDCHQRHPVLRSSLSSSERRCWDARAHRHQLNGELDQLAQGLLHGGLQERDHRGLLQPGGKQVGMRWRAGGVSFYFLSKTLFLGI